MPVHRGAVQKPQPAPPSFSFPGYQSPWLESAVKSLTAREFAHAVGASEVEPPLPVHAKSAATPPPSSAARTDKQLIGDRYALGEQWRKLIYSVESPSGINLSDPEWTNPGRQDMERLLSSTSDSVETIIAAARWGTETSNYWFKATTKGILRSFTDFVNAYAPISKQYHEYVGKSREGSQRMSVTYDEATDKRTAVHKRYTNI